MRRVLAVLAMAVLASCADDPAPTAVPGLTATLEQYREDEINGLMSVQTTNRSSSTIDVRDLRLRWPGITDESPFDSPTQMAPGVTFDIRVHQGTARCGDPPRDDGGAPPDRADGGVPPDRAVALADVSIDGAAAVPAEIPIEDTRAILPRVYQHSCQDQRAAWAGDLRFGDTWAPSTTAAGKPAVLGTIELRRRDADQPLTVTRINGSVLLRITAVPPAGPVTVLPAGKEAVTIPIRIEQSGNCDAHALTESKKTFIIPIGFAVGDEAPIAYVIRFDTPTKQLLNRMINQSCGVG